MPILFDFYYENYEVIWYGDHRHTETPEWLK